MAWSTPKTNWYGVLSQDGDYTGDFFNYTDFNRIRNNLVWLKQNYSGTVEGWVTPPGTISIGGTIRYADTQKICTDLALLYAAITGTADPTIAPLAGTFFDYRSLNKVESLMQTLHDAL